MNIAAGTRLGRYEIRSKIGVGGMGEVYLAQDPKLNRKVALKILRADLASDRMRMNRFVQEAKAASALNHPNIITIYEIDESASGQMIATEFIDGETLRRRMKSGRLSTLEVLNVAIQIVGALSAAHEAGIVHRDVKPENIMLRHDGIVKVLDFGLAKLTDQIMSEFVDTEAVTSVPIKTEPGMVMGTAIYMSPEQARGLPVDARTDIFSLGVLMYELVAHRLPFPGSDRLDVVASMLRQEPAPLARYAPETPPELERIVAKALAKQREERYQSAMELLIDLRNLKKRLDVKAEIERTIPPNLRISPTGEISAAQTAPPQAIAASPATAAIAPRLADQIWLHPRVLVVTLALLAVGIALVMFWHFKSPHAIPLTEKDTVVLADFTNTTGDPVFEGTLRQALVVQLEQSPFLNIFSDQRAREALRLMNRSADERVTREIAREICQRQGLKAFLGGSISNLGSHYVVTLEATNAQTGDTIALQQAEAESKERVLTVLGEAATKLRAKLGESLVSIQNYDVPIYQATTSSLEALKVFSLGVEAQVKGNYLEAIPLFKRAVEADSNFARAYAAMSSVYYNTGQPDLAAEASRKAYELRDRVGERERLYIAQAYYDNVTGELDKYLETLELWKRTYPRDAIPHNNLALKYNDLGQFEKGAENAREAVQLNPNAASPYSLLAGSFMGLNRFDEAKLTITQAQSHKLENLRMHQNLHRIAFVQSDAAAMNREIEWAKGKPEEYAAQLWQAEAAAFSGQLRKAKAFSTKAFDLAQRRNLKEVSAQIAAGAVLRDAQFGDCSKVREETAKALALSRGQLTLALAANALAICGDSGATKSIIDELTGRSPTDTLINQQRIPLIQAQLQLQRGYPTQALQLLEITKSYGGYLLFPIAYVRGQAYLKDQKGAEAAAQFQAIIDHRGWSALSYFYPLAQLGLARAAELQGDTSKARQAYEDFIQLWRDADPDLPMLIEAKKEYEKLK